MPLQQSRLNRLLQSQDSQLAGKGEVDGVLTAHRLLALVADAQVCGSRQAAASAFQSPEVVAANTMLPMQVTHLV